MTKRPMFSPVTPLVEDPAQPQFVRELVQAGRDADTGGYDFEQGFRKHLALVASGAPTPPWADGLTRGTPNTAGPNTAGPDTAGPNTAGPGAAPAAVAGSSLVGWLVGSAVGVAVLAGAWFASQSQHAAPAHSIQTEAKPAAALGVDHGAPRAPSADAVAVRDAAGRSNTDRGPRVTSGGPGTAHGKRGDKRVAAPFIKQRIVEAWPAAMPAAKTAPWAEAAQRSPSTAQRSPSTAQRSPSDDSAPQQRPVQSTVAPAPQQEAAQPQPAAQQPAPQDDGKLEREMAMLSMAQRVLASDPSRALSLARQGEAEFPGSMFTQERQQLLLLALVNLGDVDQARRLAKPFLRRYPTGPFSERVRRALAASTQPQQGH